MILKGFLDSLNNDYPYNTTLFSCRHSTSEEKSEYKSDFIHIDISPILYSDNGISDGDLVFYLGEDLIQYLDGQFSTLHRHMVSELKGFTTIKYTKAKNPNSKAEYLVIYLITPSTILATILTYNKN